MGAVLGEQLHPGGDETYLLYVEVTAAGGEVINKPGLRGERAIHIVPGRRGSELHPGVTRRNDQIERTSDQVWLGHIRLQEMRAGPERPGTAANVARRARHPRDSRLSKAKTGQAETPSHWKAQDDSSAKSIGGTTNPVIAPPLIVMHACTSGIVAKKRTWTSLADTVLAL